MVLPLLREARVRSASAGLCIRPNADATRAMPVPVRHRS